MFDFSKVIAKYKYDEEFSKFLYQIYIELINYYGSEEIIYNAFLNTEIRTTSNVYDYLKENNMLEVEGIVTEFDLKRSEGINFSKPIITYEEGQFIITDVKRVVLVTNIDINSTSSKATLIHELCHMVKSYENEYIVNGDTLEERSGLIRRYYKLSVENGVVKTKLIREKGVGLEEGFTILAEELITKIIVDDNYEQKGNKTVLVLAKKLIEFIDERLIRYSQMHHDDSIMHEQIENYDEIEHLADVVYKMCLEMYAKSFNLENLEEVKNKILNYLKNIKNYLVKRKEEENEII